MKTKRIVATLPITTKQSLMRFATAQGVDHSFVVQRAITKMSDHHPDKTDIVYIRGQTEQVQITLSDTAYQLLSLWSEQTHLTKSKLITYSLQKTLEDGGM